jgi:hypothetical protein
MTSRRVIIFGLAALALLAVPIQAVIDPSIENIACACIVLASSLVMLMYIGCTDALATQPLSTFALFGFCVTTQLGALLIQSVEWTSLRGSLFDGMYTFGTLAFYQSIAIIVHATFRFFSRPRSRSVHLVRGLLTWAGIYLTPSCNELWLIGFVGLASYVVYISEALLGSPLGKIGLAVNYLAWAPFLIPFYLLEVGNHYCNWRLNRSLLLGVEYARCHVLRRRHGRSAIPARRHAQRSTVERASIFSHRRIGRDRRRAGDSDVESHHGDGHCSRPRQGARGHEGRANVRGMATT